MTKFKSKNINVTLASALLALSVTACNPYPDSISDNDSSEDNGNTGGDTGGGNTGGGDTGGGDTGGGDLFVNFNNESANGALVYLDENSNGLAEEEEFIGITGSDGSLSSSKITEALNSKVEKTFLVQVTTEQDDIEIKSWLHYPTSAYSENSKAFVSSISTWLDLLIESGQSVSSAMSTISSIIPGDGFYSTGNDDVLYNVVKSSLDQHILNFGSKSSRDLSLLATEISRFSSTLPQPLAISDVLFSIKNGSVIAYSGAGVKSNPIFREENSLALINSVTEILIDNSSIIESAFEQNLNNGYRLAILNGEINIAYISSATGNPVTAKASLNQNSSILAASQHISHEAGYKVITSRPGFSETITEWPDNPHTIAEFYTSYPGSSSPALVLGVSGPTVGGYTNYSHDWSEFIETESLLASLENTYGPEPGLQRNMSRINAFGIHSKIDGYDSILIPTSFRDRATEEEIDGEGAIWNTRNALLTYDSPLEEFSLFKGDMLLSSGFNTNIEISVNNGIKVRSANSESPSLGWFTSRDGEIGGVAIQRSFGNWERMSTDGSQDLFSISNIFDSLTHLPGYDFTSSNDSGTIWGSVAEFLSLEGTHRFTLNLFSGESNQWSFKSVELNASATSIDSLSIPTFGAYGGYCSNDASPFIYHSEYSDNIFGASFDLVFLNTIDTNPIDCQQIELVGGENVNSNSGVANIALIRGADSIKVYALNDYGASQYLTEIQFTDSIWSSSLQLSPNGNYILSINNSSYLLR